jgi:hypothetical protein
MSEIKVNKISPTSGGGTVTLATSGDTIQVPSGVTIANSGTATGFGGGKIGQVQYTQITDTETSTSTSWVTIATPQVTITPSASDSTIYLSGFVNPSSATTEHFQFQLFRDTTQIAMGDAASSRERIVFGYRMDADTILAAQATTFQWIDSPGDTSAHTYSLKWKGNSGSSYYLGRPYDNTDNTNYGRSPNQIIAMEILA